MNMFWRNLRKIKVVFHPLGFSVYFVRQAIASPSFVVPIEVTSIKPHYRGQLRPGLPSAVRSHSDIAEVAFVRNQLL